MCACEHGHLNIAKRLLLEPDCDASIEDNVSPDKKLKFYITKLLRLVCLQDKVLPPRKLTFWLCYSLDSCHLFVLAGLVYLGFRVSVYFDPALTIRKTNHFY